MRRFVLLLPSLCLLPGCLVLLGTSDPSCPNEGFSGSGTFTFEGSERVAALDSAHLESSPDAQCITAVTGSLEFGQGCSLWFEADGTGDTLAIFDVGLFGAEGCGLPDGNWQVVDRGASLVRADGGTFSVGGDDSVCFDGTITVELEVVVEDDGVTASISGEATFEGIENAWFEPRECE